MPRVYPSGFEVRDLGNGAMYLRLEHFASKRFDAAWLEEMRRKMPRDVFNREILMREDVATGQPIYSNYDDEIHVHRDKDGNEAFIPVMPGSLYYGGWDCGQTLTPAFVIYQVMPRPFQVHALAECVSEGGEPMEIFAPRVLRTIMQVLPGEWDQIRHHADSTVTSKDGTRGGTAQGEAKKHGFAGNQLLQPETNVWAPRLGAMIWLFQRRLDDGKAGFKIDAKRCPTLRAACQGKYRYKVRKTGDPDGPGAVIIEPDKNGYSHVAEAAQYPAMVIRKFIEGDLRGDVRRYAG